MPRPRYRACLQDGLKLDLNHLARKGFIKFGANIGARGISWGNSHQGEIASGVISIRASVMKLGRFLMTWSISIKPDVPSRPFPPRLDAAVITMRRRDS